MFGSPGIARVVLLAFVACSAVLGWACGPDEPTATCKVGAEYPVEGVGVLDGSLLLEGPNGSFSARDEHATCAASRELLVLRVTAPWCGTCDWDAKHFASEVKAETRQAIRLVDIVVGDIDNAAPTLATATEWRKQADYADLTVVDPDWLVARKYTEDIQLPAYLIIDPTSMRIVQKLGNPSPRTLRTALNEGLATLRNDAPPVEPDESLYDGRFLQSEWDMIRSASLGRQLLKDPSNRYADDLVAAGIGRRFFFEKEWSKTKQLSCETCHVPTPAFVDGKPVSQGVGFTDRNAPTVLTAAFDRWLFADGRADSAWMQALGPLEARNELGSSRLRVAHVIAERYADVYSRTFQATLPPLEDTARFPPEGMPGDPAWEGMTAEDQDAVNRIFANVGKGIAAYERSIFMQQTSFDRYAAGELLALSDEQKLGLKEFFQFGCAQCHHGPTLSNNAFHNLRFPTGRADGAADLGRAAAFEQLSRSEFNRSGRYSDAPTAAYSFAGSSSRYEGAFKTPTLRLIGLTAPYGHGGTSPTLDELMDLYRTKGLPAGVDGTVGLSEPWIVPFSANEGTHIIPFMKSFIGGATWW